MPVPPAIKHRTRNISFPITPPTPSSLLFSPASCSTSTYIPRIAADRIRQSVLVAPYLTRDITSLNLRLNMNVYKMTVYSECLDSCASTYIHSFSYFSTDHTYEYPTSSARDEPRLSFIEKRKTTHERSIHSARARPLTPYAVNIFSKVAAESLSRGTLTTRQPRCVDSLRWTRLGVRKNAPQRSGVEGVRARVGAAREDGRCARGVGYEAEHATEQVHSRAHGPASAPRCASSCTVWALEKEGEALHSGREHCAKGFPVCVSFKFSPSLISRHSLFVHYYTGHMR